MQHTRDDQDLVERVFEQLRLCELIDPRLLEFPTAPSSSPPPQPPPPAPPKPPLDSYIRSEILKSIKRVRGDDYSYPTMPTMAKITHAKNSLQLLIGTAVETPEIKMAHEQLDQLSRGQRFPSDKADGQKYFQAKEAFDLMELFCAKEPTTTLEKPFRIIASLLHEAATGDDNIDLENACKLVLRDVKERRGKKWWSPN